MVAKAVDFPVANREHGLGIFGGNAEHGNHPHPEHGTWATDGDCTSDTSNVAGADGGRQRGHQRLKGGDVAIVLGGIPLQQHANAVGQPLQGHEAQPQHQQDAGEGNQEDHRPPPNDSINWIVDAADELLHAIPRLSEGWCHS